MENIQIRILLSRERCSRFWLADNNIRAWPVKGLARLRFLENFPWENQNGVSELRGKPLCIMQRMEESRSRDPGTKGKRERIADMPFIAIGSKRLSPPPTPLAVQSRQTRIRHKHRCSYRRLPAPVSPITIMLTTSRTALSSLTDMIHISFFRKKRERRLFFPTVIYVAISRSWFRNCCVTWKLLDIRYL